MKTVQSNQKQENQTMKTIIRILTFIVSRVFGAVEAFRFVYTTHRFLGWIKFEQGGDLQREITKEV